MRHVFPDKSKMFPSSYGQKIQCVIRNTIPNTYKTKFITFKACSRNLPASDTIKFILVIVITPTNVIISTQCGKVDNINLALYMNQLLKFMPPK